MATNLTLLDLRRYVRELTGIYSTDIVTDTFINKSINETYFELAKTQQWSWSAGSGLTSDSSYPAFPADYHPLLAYSVAAKIGKQQGDDSGRTDTYQAKAAEYINLLYMQDLQGGVDGLINTYDNLAKFTRLLLGTFDNSITNTFIINKLKEEYVQLNENYTWPWKTDAGFAADPTNLSYLNANYERKDVPSTATSAFTFAKILPYGAGAKIALIQNKPDLAKALQAEYDTILEEMTKVLLHGKLLTIPQTIPSINDTSLSTLVELTKQLTADHTNDVPPFLIQQWLIEEASNLTLERDWAFLKNDLMITIPAGVDNFNGPVDDFSVISMYVVDDNGLTIDEVKHRPHLLDVDKNSPRYYYQLIGRNTVKIAPVPDKNLTLYFRIVDYTYLTYNEDFTEAYVLFTDHFKMILPYRVAIKALAYTEQSTNAKNLIPIYQEAADRLYQNMINYYNGENNMESIQLGALGLDTKKYIPYFRVI